LKIVHFILIKEQRKERLMPPKQNDFALGKFYLVKLTESAKIQRGLAEVYNDKRETWEDGWMVLRFDQPFDLWNSSLMFNRFSPVTRDTRFWTLYPHDIAEFIQMSEAQVAIYLQEMEAKLRDYCDGLVRDLKRFAGD